MKDCTYTVKTINKEGDTKIYTYVKNYGDKYVCECGGKSDRTNKSRHNKSKRHQRYMNGLNALKSD